MADRYWVGGTAAWDGTAGSKWALTSGGAGGQSVPTSADDVFFSNLSTGTCTISAGNTGAKSINCTGFTGTITGISTISVSGSVTLAAGMTYTYAAEMTFLGTGTITSAGKSFANIRINGSGITVTLGDALTLNTANTFTLSSGTLNLNGFTLSTGRFDGGVTGIRAIQFGTQNIALTSTTAATTVLSFSQATNFTYTGTGGFTRNMVATATINFGSTGGTATNAPNMTVNAGASELTIGSNSLFKNLNFTGSTSTVTAPIVSIAGSLTLASGGTYTALNPTFITTQTFTSLGKTVGNTTIDGSNITVTLGDALTLATTGTFTLTQGILQLNGFTLSTGAFSSSNSNGRAIGFGSANIALTSTTAATTVLSMGNATNFIYTGTGGFTRNMAATATVTFGSSGGSVSNAPNLTVNAGASALSTGTGQWFKALNFTGSTCTVTGAVNIAGSLTFASGGTYSSFTPTFRTTQTFTSLGKTIAGLTIDGLGITLTLGDALTLGGAGTTQLAQGTLNLGGFTLTTPSLINVTPSNTFAITFGSANIALTRTTAGSILSISNATNFTYTGTGGFIRNMVADSTVDFGTTGGSITKAPNLTISSGASALTITNNSWLKNLNFTGSTSTVTSTNVNIAGNLTLASGGTYTATASTHRGTGSLTNNGKTLSALTVDGSGITVTCSDALTVTDALTLALGTLRLKNAVTSTVGSIVTTGTTLKFLVSSTAGSQATISDTTGTNTVTYLSIKDSNATGGAVFDASDPTNVDAGNNAGWSFGAGGGNFIAFFM